jgi:hypothetical protein
MIINSHHDRGRFADCRSSPLSLDKGWHTFAREKGRRISGRFADCRSSPLSLDKGWHTFASEKRRRISRTACQSAINNNEDATDVMVQVVTTP